MLDAVAKFIFLLIFVFLVTPVGVILRLLGVDYLDQKIDKQKESYWIKR